jgi:hypothetical protein
MKYSISEAARIVGVTRKTFYKHIDKKSISVEKDENDMPVIDASELIRIYGDQCDFGFQKKDEDTEPGKQGDTGLSTVPRDEMELLKGELALFEQRVEFLSKEIEARKEDAERWQEAFEKAQATADKITALLTDQSSDKGDRAQAWDQSLKALEKRIANQERAAREQKEERQKILGQNRALKKALEEERSKPFWKKLIG